MAGRRLSSPEAGLLGGTNTTTMFWVQDKCYACLWSLKVTEFPASVPRGKRSKSGKGKRKRSGEALLWINLFLATENVLESTLSESACSSRGRMTSQVDWESQSVLLWTLMSSRTKSGDEKILETNTVKTHSTYCSSLCCPPLWDSRCYLCSLSP